MEEKRPNLIFNKKSKKLEEKKIEEKKQNLFNNKLVDLEKTQIKKKKELEDSQKKKLLKDSKKIKLEVLKIERKKKLKEKLKKKRKLFQKEFIFTEKNLKKILNEEINFEEISKETIIKFILTEKGFFFKLLN
jgi:hypothetical protein